MSITRVASAPAIRSSRMQLGDREAERTWKYEPSLRRSEIVASAAASRATLMGLDRRVQMAPTQSKKVLHSTPRYKQFIAEYDSSRLERSDSA